MLAWFASLLIMGFIAYAYGVGEIKEKYESYEEKYEEYESTGSGDVPSDAIIGCINIAKIFGLCAAFALVISFVWVTILILFGELLIGLLFGAAITLFVVMGASQLSVAASVAHRVSPVARAFRIRCRSSWRLLLVA